MNGMFKHAHADSHHEHHYISHLVHDERFWVGLGITLLFGLVVWLSIFAAKTTVPPTTFFPYY